MMFLGKILLLNWKKHQQHVNFASHLPFHSYLLMGRINFTSIWEVFSMFSAAHQQCVKMPTLLEIYNLEVS